MALFIANPLLGAMTSNRIESNARYQCRPQLGRILEHTTFGEEVQCQDMELGSSRLQALVDRNLSRMKDLSCFTVSGIELVVSVAPVQTFHNAADTHQTGRVRSSFRLSTLIRPRLNSANSIFAACPSQACIVRTTSQNGRGYIRLTTVYGNGKRWAHLEIGLAVMHTKSPATDTVLQGPRAKAMLYPYYALLISTTSGSLYCARNSTTIR